MIFKTIWDVLVLTHLSEQFKSKCGIDLRQELKFSFDYPFVLAAAADLISPDELPDKGKTAKEHIIKFFHKLDQDEPDIYSGKRIEPIKGDHCVGALFRYALKEIRKGCGKELDPKNLPEYKEYLGAHRCIYKSLDNIPKENYKELCKSLEGITARLIFKYERGRNFSAEVTMPIFQIQEKDLKGLCLNFESFIEDYFGYMVPDAPIGRFKHYFRPSTYNKLRKDGIEYVNLRFLWEVEHHYSPIGPGKIWLSGDKLYLHYFIGYDYFTSKVAEGLIPNGKDQEGGLPGMIGVKKGSGGQFSRHFETKWSGFDENNENKRCFNLIGSKARLSWINYLVLKREAELLDKQLREVYVSSSKSSTPAQ